MNKRDAFRTSAILIIIAAGLAVYLNTFVNGFVWDDEFLIVKNEFIRDFAHLKDIFTNDVHRFGNIRSNFYRPIQTLTYMFDYAFWGLDPTGYHITNAALHIINGILIYILLFSIVSGLKDNNPRNTALFTAVLWIVHPIHTQCVSYISGRADLLAAAFMLLSLYAYINAKNCVLPIIFFLLALISKETSIITPLFFVAYDFVRPEGRIGNFRRYLPYAVIIAVFVFLRFTIIRFPGAPFIDARANFYSRLMTSSHAIMILLGLLVLPFGLNMTRNIPWEATALDPRVFGSILGLVLIFAYALWVRSRSRSILFGILWFFIAYLPMANIFPLNANVSEHWMYLPSVGFFFIVSTLSVKNLSFKRGMAIAVFPILFYAALTIMRNFDWKDEARFYEKTLRTSPKIARVHYNLGVVYGLKGANDKAKEQFTQAIRLQPDYAQAHSNLGLILFREGKVDEAIALYKRADSLDKNLVENHANLGVAYGKKGLFDEARDEYEKALKLNPNHTGALNGLGVVYGRRGEYKKSEECFNRILEIDPNNKEARDNLAYQKFLMKTKK